MKKPENKTGKLPIPDSRKIREISDLLSEWLVKYPNSFKRVTLNVEFLMSIKSPAVRQYAADFIASSDCMHIMTHVEYACFHWLLQYSWINEMQCFLPYEIEILRKNCQVTERKFIAMWNHVLGRKFKFARYEDQLYIYNQRQWDELMKQQAMRNQSGKGGKAAQEKLRSEKQLHSFDKSPFFDKSTFIEKLKSDNYFRDIDHEYYYQVVLNWAQGKVPAPTSGDWMSKSKSIILSNITKARSKIRISPAVKPEAISKIEKNLRDHAERERKILEQYEKDRK